MEDRVVLMACLKTSEGCNEQVSRLDVICREDIEARRCQIEA